VNAASADASQDAWVLMHRFVEARNRRRELADQLEAHGLVERRPHAEVRRRQRSGCAPMTESSCSFS